MPEIVLVKQHSQAAARFFRKVLQDQHTQAPRVITVDENADYPVAIEALKEDETMFLNPAELPSRAVLRMRRVGFQAR